jgi:hypothetical protein
MPGLLARNTESCFAISMVIEVVKEMGCAAVCLPPRQPSTLNSRESAVALLNRSADSRWKFFFLHFVSAFNVRSCDRTLHPS